MNKHSFTLIEVVAAMIIMAIGLISILEAIVMGNKVLALRKDRTIAAYFLQMEMEEAKYQGYSDGIIDWPSSQCPTLGSVSQLRQCTFKIKKIDYPSHPHLRFVSITVNWSPAGWGPQSESLATLITNR